MRYVTAVVVALFLLKIIWNLTIPYALAIRLWRNRNADTVSTSLMSFIEVVLLGIVTVLSLFDIDSFESWTVGKTLLVGGGIIAASYAHFFIAGFVLGWIGSKLRGRAQR